MTTPANSYHRQLATATAARRLPVDHRGARSTTTTCATRIPSPPASRDDAPVVFAERLGYVVVSRMEDIDAVFTDPDMYASVNVQDPVFPFSDGAAAGARGTRLRPDRGDVEPARAGSRPHPRVHPRGLLQPPVEVARAVHRRRSHELIDAMLADGYAGEFIAPSRSRSPARPCSG